MYLVFDTCHPLAGDGDGNGPRAVLEFPFVGVRGADDDCIFAVIPFTFNILRGI